jgi:RNA polymerase sigma-70 factor (ECF subfamily)
MDAISFLHFETLFKDNHQRLCSVAYNLVRDRDVAKDIVQDVFYKVWKNRDKIDATEKIEGYLMRATSRTALNYLRNNWRTVKIDREPLLVRTLKAAPTSEEIDFTELEIRVRQAIDKLPPKCKTIYLLSRHEGLKYPQIADSLGLSLKTVENQMSIALEKLRNSLKPFITPELIFILVILLGWVLLNTIIK